MEQLFVFDNRKSERFSADYRSIVARQCFDGEIGMGPHDGDAELVLAMGADQPVPIMSLTASVDTFMRRNWSHIRATEQHVYIIWLVRKGRLRMNLTACRHVSEEGRIAIFDSSLPFVSEALVDAQGEHNSIYAVVPAHLFRTFIPDFHGLAGSPFAAHSADGRVLQDILTLLYDEGDKLDAGIARELMEVALKSLHRLVVLHRGVVVPPTTVREERLKAIEAYIDGHLTDPHLSAAKVADALGITTRYVSYLLKDMGASFASIVSKKRQGLARTWLSSPEARHLSIKQIAILAGYKGLTQFGRAFRSQHGISPSEFRITVLSEKMRHLGKSVGSA